MKLIADERVDQLISDLGRQIIAGTVERERLQLIRIRRPGRRPAARIGQETRRQDVGSIDITLYRDDLSETGAAARVSKTNIPFDIGGEIVLCDDVIMTGRSVLAAIREILDFGRPAAGRVRAGRRPEREPPLQPSARRHAHPGGKVDVRLKGQDEGRGRLDQPQKSEKA